MLIEKDGKFYNVEEGFTQDEINIKISQLEDSISITQGYISNIWFWDTTELEGEVLDLVEKANAEKEAERETLENEIILLNEELDKWQ